MRRLRRRSDVRLGAVASLAQVTSCVKTAAKELGCQNCSLRWFSRGWNTRLGGGDFGAVRRGCKNWAGKVWLYGGVCRCLRWVTGAEKPRRCGSVSFLSGFFCGVFVWICDFGELKW